jgi:hypothetical protein
MRRTLICAMLLLSALSALHAGPGAVRKTLPLPPDAVQPAVPTPTVPVVVTQADLARLAVFSQLQPTWNVAPELRAENTNRFKQLPADLQDAVLSAGGARAASVARPHHDSNA